MLSDSLKQNRVTLILIACFTLLLVGGYFSYQRFFVKSQSAQVVEEQDLTFDPEGPYAILSPRRDGNALILNLKRTASYDSITYELAYTSEGIDRGVMGTINTQDKKGEYIQEILFGTCSKNVCKYDKDVENGTLTLHIKKDNQAFRMITQWHLLKPDVALGVLTSGDGHMTYKIDSGSTDLSLLKYVIVNDLTGAPKLPSGKVVIGKVYAVNSPETKELPKGVLTLEMAETPMADYKISRFNEIQNKWVEYETKIDSGKLLASVDSGGVIAVLTSKK